MIYIYKIIKSQNHTHIILKTTKSIAFSVNRWLIILLISIIGIWINLLQPAKGMHNFFLKLVNSLFLCFYLFFIIMLLLIFLISSNCRHRHLFLICHTRLMSIVIIFF